MKIGSIVMATLLLCGGLAVAQVCPTSPGTVCLVPSRTPSAAATTPTTYTPVTSTSMVCPPGMVMVPATGMVSTSMACPSGMVMVPATGVGTSACPGGVSADTACLLNQITALQNEMRMSRAQMLSIALQMQGQQLASRMDQLIADETAFRQQLAANPNLPNAQQRAQQLQLEATALNRDIVAFNSSLNAVPADQRPFLAASLNTFDTIYWTPAQQRFAAYSNQFPQNATAYQAAAAANPWLPAWQTSYQASITNIATPTITVASARWWTDTRVLGSMETFPNGMMMVPAGSTVVTPNGTVYYIPQSTPMMMGTTGTMMQ